MGVSGNEGPGIETWIYGQLSVDAAVQGFVAAPPNARIYQGHVPEGVTTFPCVVFVSQVDEPDTRPVGRYRVMATRHYLVKVIDKASSYLGVAGLANRLDELLDGQMGSAAAGGATTQIIACTREHAVDYPETLDGVEYRHLGAIYKVLAQQV